MRQVSSPLTAKRLFIADLAQRLDLLESGCGKVDATAYRLFARRLHAALAGYPRTQLQSQLSSAPASVLAALEQRHFEAHGVFTGAGAEAAQAQCDALLWRLTQPSA